jgi:hypothetical protein
MATQKKVDWSKDFSRLESCKYSAYALLKDGKYVGCIRFKFPKDGAGRLYVQYHIRGEDLMQASADGYGYDKQTAALSGATIKGTLIEDDGHHWDRQLKDAGFEVWSTL